MKDVVIICRNTEETKVVLGWIFEACPELYAHENDKGNGRTRDVRKIELNWIGVNHPWPVLTKDESRLYFTRACDPRFLQTLVCPEKHQVLKALRDLGFNPQEAKAEAPTEGRLGRLQMISLQAEWLCKQG